MPDFQAFISQLYTRRMRKRSSYGLWERRQRLIEYQKNPPDTADVTNKPATCVYASPPTATTRTFQRLLLQIDQMGLKYRRRRRQWGKVKLLLLWLKTLEKFLSRSKLPRNWSNEPLQKHFFNRSLCQGSNVYAKSLTLEIFESYQSMTTTDTRDPQHSQFSWISRKTELLRTILHLWIDFKEKYNRDFIQHTAWSDSES
jgi:hypothetical protein